MVNPIANVLKVSAIIIGVLGFWIGLMGGINLLIWVVTFFVCILLLGFSELIEQSTIQNEKMDELLERFSAMEKGTRWNQNKEVEENVATEKEKEKTEVTNEDWNEYLSRNCDEENERVAVEPIYLHDGSIKCPLCDTVQSSANVYCWQCEAIFKKEDEIT